MTCSGWQMKKIDVNICTTTGSPPPPPTKVPSRKPWILTYKDSQRTEGNKIFIMDVTVNTQIRYIKGINGGIFKDFLI